jgi:hypothetical protein
MKRTRTLPVSISLSWCGISVKPLSLGLRCQIHSLVSILDLSVVIYPLIAIMAFAFVPVSKSVEESKFLNVLPVELRLRIYEHLYADLINELSDNLYGVFSLYDFMYDYTSASLESHVGTTGLTTMLYTCKKVHDEALETLCNKAEFVVNVMGDDDSDDEERIDIRFSEASRRKSNLKCSVLWWLQWCIKCIKMLFRLSYTSHMIERLFVIVALEL